MIECHWSQHLEQIGQDQVSGGVSIPCRHAEWYGPDTNCDFLVRRDECPENHCHNLTTMRDRTFTFHICIPCNKTFTPYRHFDLVTLKFDLLFKIFNIGHKMLVFKSGCLSGNFVVF